MEVKVTLRKLCPDAVLPKYATSGSAGFDLTVTENIEVPPKDTVLVRTGLAMEIPFGFELQIRPRSGVSLKTPLRIANAPGTIDADYRGEICLIVTNTSSSFWDIKKGERIAQGVIAPVIQAQFQEVHELSATDRGDGGFGSTGK